LQEGDQISLDTQDMSVVSSAGVRLA